MEGLPDRLNHNFPDACETDASEANLWQRWHGAEDPIAREELINRFMPHARMLAAVVYKGRFHDEVEFADYHQLACVGLIEAVERFKPDLGVSFKAFASHRIRGAILNGLEKQTEKNQQIAAQQRLRKDRIDSLKAEAKSSMAEKVTTSSGNDARSLLAYMADVGIGLALGVMLEGTRMLVAEEDTEASTVASPEVGYFRRREALQLQEALRNAIEKLEQSEQRVIRYHYQQDLAFEEISRLLGVSRSRISQIHRKALLGLRQALAHGPPCDVFF